VAVDLLQPYFIVKIEAGRHSAALSVQGDLFMWGPVFQENGH